MRRCSKCNSMVEDGLLYCSICGADMSEQKENEAIVPEAEAEPVVVKTSPSPTQDKELREMGAQLTEKEKEIAALKEELDELDEPVSTGAFIALLFVFAIPVVGFLFALVFAIAAGNRNLRHIGLARVVAFFIVFCILAIVFIAVYSYRDVLIDVVNRMM